MAHCHDRDDAYVCELSPVVIKQAEEELGENEERRKQSIENIRQWLYNQSELNWKTDPVSLLNFIRGCKYDLDKTKAKITAMAKAKGTMPEFFTSWDPFLPENQEVLEAGCTLPLPGFDHKGRKVLYVRTGCYDPRKLAFEAIQRVGFMVSTLMILESEQMFITGMVLILDFKGFGVGHMTSVSFSSMKKFIYCWQDASPVRPKSMCVVSTGYLFTSVFNIFQSFMRSKMRERVQVLGNNREALRKEVPEEILPKELGGSGSTIAELTRYWKRKCEEHRDVLIAEEQFKANELNIPENVEVAGEALSTLTFD